MLSNPVVLKEVAELLIKKQDSDTKKMLAEAQATELHTKAQQLPNQGGVNPLEAQIKQAMAQADMQLKGADLQLKQAQIAEVQAKGQLDRTADPMKMADLQLRQRELDQKQEDAELDAINRKRDRESRERLAAVKLAEDMAANPQGLGVINSILDPNMVQRLESNEPKLKSGSD
jgi:hypothetical protein